MFEMLLMMTIILVMCGFIIGITPYVTRRNVHFGVMFPDQANELPEVKQWKKQFLILSIVLSVLCIVLLLFSAIFLDLSEEIVGTISTVIIFVLLIAQGGMYIYFHRSAKALKDAKFKSTDIQQDARIMVSTDFHNQKMVISNIWFVIVGGIIILVTAVVPILLYDQIPDYIPRHLNYFNSDINQLTWLPKSPRIFALLPLTQFVMLLILMFVNYMFKVAKQLIVPQNAKRSAEQNRAFRNAMSKVMFVYTISLLSLLAVPQFLMVGGIEPSPRDGWIVMIWLVLLFILFIYVILKYGQGGERYKPPQTIENKYQLVDDDRYWKWGVFYYNPYDPAIFVEKRFGIGLTVNFARWQAWAFFIGILAFVIIMIIATMFLER